MIRFAFISKTDVKLEVTTTDDVDWCRLPLKAGGPNEEVVDQLKAGTWTVTVDKEVVFGFRTAELPKIVAEGAIDLLIAENEDPWPKPPPPPPPPYQMTQAEFDKHLHGFLYPR